MDNKQEAVPNEDDSAERMKILNSILDEIVKLKITTKNYENALYKREQVQEAAQVEKFTEEAPATKEGQSEESGGKAGPLDELEKNPAIKKLIDFANTIIDILRPALLTLVAFAPILINLIKKAVPFIKELPGMIYDKMKEVLEYLGPIFKEYIVDPVHKFFTINLPAALDVLSMVIGDAITNLLYFPLTVINQIKQFAEEIGINALTSFIDFVKTSKLLSWLGINVTTVTEGAEKMVGAATARKKGLQKEQQARDEEKAGITNTSYTDQYNKGVAQRTKTANAPTPAFKVSPGKSKPQATSQSKTANGKQLADELKALGITNENAIAAILATASKESGLNPAAKEAGASAWLKTAKSKGIDYIYKIFPQLRPGGRVSKKLGLSEGMSLEQFIDLASKGDTPFFDTVYMGTGENASKYIGRGFVQITGKAVYKKIGELIGVDLEENPDLVATDFKVASAALLAYLANSIGQGKLESGMSALNSFPDYDTALKVVIANVGAGNAGANMAKINAKFEGSGGMAQNFRHQLAKANEFGSQAVEIADNSGQDINSASMAAKIEEPGATTTIVNAQASAQGPVDVTPDKTSKNKPNSTTIQNAYHAHLGVTLTG